MKNINIEKDLLIKEISEKIREIRRELNLKDVDFEIVDIEIIWEDNDTFLNICVPTRSDKSTIIGPGGWVVGKLREYLKDRFPGNLKILVDTYTDRLILKKKEERALSILKRIGLKKGERVLVLVQCSYDLGVLDFLRKCFKVFAVSLNIGSVVLPPKNRKLIEDYFVRYKIPHKSLDPIKLKGEDIRKVLGGYPCDLCNGIVFKYLIEECRRMEIRYLINNNHTSQEIERLEDVYIINFLKLYPLKRDILRKNYPYLKCPLMIQTLKENEDLKVKRIGDIVSEVYEGLMEPGIGAEVILEIGKLGKNKG
ncbi:hypothetical protein CFE53_02775 [Methanofervidicoccus sp. A16]|uniref:hypothetical protein n=1 Tax=Methanofervidicoccus sp. A16 TaxID=2607662 RepID=UPI00118D21C3|nr:hypothetical protein [Methanofervidicoccus sp. A16]AXI25131.1 hypothetical protein CFE53_02775 [Methanofervidicoccus sp. A16]